MRTKKLAPDYWLLGATITLLAVGVVLVFDASFARAGEMRLTGNDSWYFVKRQLVFAAVGLVAMLAAMRINLVWYRRLAVPFTLTPTPGISTAIKSPSEITSSGTANMRARIDIFDIDCFQ